MGWVPHVRAFFVSSPMTSFTQRLDTSFTLAREGGRGLRDAVEEVRRNSVMMYYRHNTCYRTLHLSTYPSSASEQSSGETASQPPSMRWL